MLFGQVSNNGTLKEMRKNKGESVFWKSFKMRSFAHVKLEMALIAVVIM